MVGVSPDPALAQSGQKVMMMMSTGHLTAATASSISVSFVSLPVQSWRLTFDYQLIANPAYNRDRGPVSVIGTRLLTQF